MKKEDLKVGVKYDIIMPTDKRFKFDGYTFTGITPKGTNFLSEHISFAKEGKEDLHMMSSVLTTKVDRVEITESK
jgi:hypothetical protein